MQVAAKERNVFGIKKNVKPTVFAVLLAKQCVVVGEPDVLTILKPANLNVFAQQFALKN